MIALAEVAVEPQQPVVESKPANLEIAVQSKLYHELNRIKALRIDPCTLSEVSTKNGFSANNNEPAKDIRLVRLQGLFYSVLERACFDLRPEENILDRRSAALWILSKPLEEELFSFTSICDLLELSQKMVDRISKLASDTLLETR